MQAIEIGGSSLRVAFIDEGVQQVAGGCESLGHISVAIAVMSISVTASTIEAAFDLVRGVALAAERTRARAAPMARRPRRLRSVTAW